jgi:hypothetical protein
MSTQAGHEQEARENEAFFPISGQNSAYES